MPDIRQQVGGMTPEGEAVILYTLRNARGAEVRLSNCGAAVTAVVVPDRDGRMADVTAGSRGPGSYDPADGGRTLGRVAGGIGYGRTPVESGACAPDVNRLFDGSTKGFADRLWESRAETNRVVMDLISEAGDMGYPGTLSVEAIFDFDDDNSLEITYLARTDRTTPVNLVCNLCLNLSGTSHTSVLDHRLRLRSS